jgi:hypothetical protein
MVTPRRPFALMYSGDSYISINLRHNADINGLTQGKTHLPITRTQNDYVQRYDFPCFRLDAILNNFVYAIPVHVYIGTM